MKKLFLAVVACLLMLPFAKQSQAQDVFGLGTSVVNVGVGYHDTYNSLPPINVSYDYGIKGNLFDEHSTLSVGGAGSVAASQYYRAFIVGPTFGLHYCFIPKLDTYFKLMLGYINVSYNSDFVGTKIAQSAFSWGSHLGVRYFFTPAIGGFFEAGYGTSYASLGISFRL